MEKKKCTGPCAQELPLNDFHKNSSKKDGLQSMCKVCRKKYHGKHYQDNKQKYIEQNRERRQGLRDYINRYKAFCGCRKCGDKRWYVLDFHHTSGKEFTISDKIKNACGLSTLKTEIRKCEVLCANCHREVHYLESAGNA